MLDNLEKLYFVYLWHNPLIMDAVDPYYFKIKEIGFVYDILKQYHADNPNAMAVTPKQLALMVMAKDPQHLQIPKESLKALLTFNIDEYDEEHFIKEQLRNWVTVNRLMKGVTGIMESARKVSAQKDSDSIQKIMKEIQAEVSSMVDYGKLSAEEEDFGSDFDDPDKHSQDHALYKVPTGFKLMDEVTGGGWSAGTLNILLGETNNGKSLCMQNFAVRAADLGYNVMYITLEMIERSVLKRLGSMSLQIPINKYDELSVNREYMAMKIAERNQPKNELVQKKVGKMFTKFWPPSTVGPDHIEQFIKKFQVAKGIKIDFLVIDYGQKVIPDKKADSLYTSGNVIADGLRALAARLDIPVLTALQLSRAAWNSLFISTADVPDSKGWVETPDKVFSIIRTEAMKKRNMFILEKIKDRDGTTDVPAIEFKQHPLFLTLSDDTYVTSERWEEIQNFPNPKGEKDNRKTRNK